MLGFEIDVLPFIDLRHLDVLPTRLQLLHLPPAEIVHFLCEVEVEDVGDIVLQDPGKGLEVARVDSFNVL